jgi:hypothetical protein
MSKTKYIKTGDNQIIVFGELYQHSDFRKFNPVSAGFIFFNHDSDGMPDCHCYGESYSLQLKSDEIIDTKLARLQILGYDYY